MPLKTPKKYSQAGFNRSLAIQQTGARQIGKNRYELGGAVFSGKQLAKGRAQFAIVKFNVPKIKAYKSVGLKMPKL